MFSREPEPNAKRVAHVASYARTGRAANRPVREGEGGVWLWGKVGSVALRQTGAALSGATPPAENSIPRNEGGSAVSVR